MYSDDGMQDSGILPDPVPNSPHEKRLQEKQKMILELQTIIDKPLSEDSENELLTVMQQHRRLLLDVAMETFMKKPSASILDSINSLLGSIEKKTRDDRKEKAKVKEREDNKASFSMYVNALNEIAAGNIKIPNYGDTAIVLDPLKPFIELDERNELREGELLQGRIELDVKEVEESLTED
jgi:uncharacterized protein (DUF885 family)